MTTPAKGREIKERIVREIDGQPALKPCPFCGGSNVGMRYFGMEATFMRVECNDCAAFGPLCSIIGPNAKEPADLWNKRKCDCLHPELKDEK